MKSGPGRNRMLTKLAAMGMSVAVIALALAAPASAGSLRPQRSVVHGRIDLSTLVGSLRIREAPSTRATVLGRLGQRGTTVTVNCWASGTPVVGNLIWYHIAEPRQGYVTSYYIDTHFDPIAGLSRCVSHTFRRSYRTLVAGLRIRSRPTTHSDILVQLGRIGTRVTVDCYTDGTSVGGDSIWYHLVQPRSGYITGRDLNTGSDPAPGVPRC